MGIKRLPATNDYWKTDGIVGCPELVQQWSCRSFWQMMHFLHLNDNAKAKSRGDPQYDKLHKVRPVLDAICKNCLIEYSPGQYNSIDEAMIGFKGRSSLKQYVPLKPTKRGYKVWCRADANTGYMCEFYIYTGAGDDSTKEDGLGGAVVKKLAKALYGKGYICVFDNYFSSVQLLADLLKENMFAVATTRSNRKEFPDELKSLQGLTRGEHHSVLVSEGKVEAFVWKDKRNVNFLNTLCPTDSMTFVKRKQKDGSSTLVTCPQAVRAYNSGMGGVDIADHKRKLYSCSRKSQKWWPRIFWFLVDISIVNAHILETLSPNHRNRSQKDFRVELARTYLQLFCARGTVGRPNKASSSPQQSHVSSGGHWPTRVEKRRRCASCRDKLDSEVRSWYICVKCDVGLCPECFECFHKNLGIY